MKNAIETMQTRRSIRTYVPNVPVDRKVIEEIVDCARLAPTAMNDQPWDFVVVTGKEALASIPPMLGHAQYVANASFAVLVLARPTNYAVEDCSAACQNLHLAGEAHGLGSCWVAGTRQPYGPAVVKAFGVPEDRSLIAIISFGVPAETPVVEKRTLAEVLHWERF
jgi:nitroreductase